VGAGGGGILAVSTQLDNWKEGGKGSIKLGTLSSSSIQVSLSVEETLSATCQGKLSGSLAAVSSQQ
jgi:hypothetical protein